MKSLLLAACALGLAAGGCTPARVRSEVQPDGKWQRTVTLVSDDRAKGAAEAFHSVFSIPAGGAWNVTHTTEKDQTTTVASRTAAPDEAVVDLKHVPVQNGGVASNEARVHRLADGRWQYREVYHWTGPRMPQVAEGERGLARALLPILDPSRAPADAKWITHRISTTVWQSLLGPPTPLIVTVNMHPDLAEEQMLSRIGPSIQRDVESRWAARLPRSQRRALTRRLATAAAAYTIALCTEKRDEILPSGQKGGSSIVITCELLSPAPVSTTNGTLDSSRRRVTWTLYPLAAQRGDVELVATWKP